MVEDEAGYGAGNGGRGVLGQVGGWEEIKIEKAKMAWRL